MALAKFFLAPALARRLVAPKRSGGGSRLAGHGSPVTARRSRLAALAARGAAEDFSSFQVSFPVGTPFPARSSQAAAPAVAGAKPAVPFPKAVIPFPKPAATFRPATVHLPKVAAHGRKEAAPFGKVAVHGRKAAVTFRPGTAASPPFSATTPCFYGFYQFWGGAASILDCGVLDCGGKRSATPLSCAQPARINRKSPVRPKAVSPLRSATAVQNLAAVSCRIPKTRPQNLLNRFRKFTVP